MSQYNVFNKVVITKEAVMMWGPGLLQEDDI